MMQASSNLTRNRVQFRDISHITSQIFKIYEFAEPDQTVLVRFGFFTFGLVLLKCGFYTVFQKTCDHFFDNRFN